MAVLTAHGAVYVDQFQIRAFVVAALLHGVVYAAAVVVILRYPGGMGTLVAVLAVAVVLRMLAMTAMPHLTTDAYRYVWDGRLGWEGINPFAYVPADPALAHLRDGEIYPFINQKERAVTIYPPVAQLVFMAGVALHDGIAGMKAIMVLFEAVTVAALIGWMRAEGLPPSRVLIYAWNPLPIWEFASQAHFDSAATALLVLGIWAAVSRRQGLTGVLFSLAALVKYFPLVLLPALWRRWDWRLPAALFVTAATLYLPYLSGSGGNILGFLGKHLDNEGYRAGWGFHAVWYLRDFGIADPPGWLYVGLALTGLFALAAWAVFARGRNEFRHGRLVLLGAAFVFLTSPHYPWYFGFLAALAVRLPHPALVAMTVLSLTLHWPRVAEVSWSHLYAVAFGVPLAIWAASAIAVRIWRGAADPASAQPPDARQRPGVRL